MVIHVHPASIRRLQCLFLDTLTIPVILTFCQIMHVQHVRTWSLHIAMKALYGSIFSLPAFIALVIVHEKGGAQAV